MRADAQRNRDRLVAVAADVIGEYGADASLEEIARRAGVGSATLHRHFGGRIALLEAVFRSSIDAVCAQATELLDDPDPLRALTAWLQTMVAHATGSRGLAAALVMSGDCGSDAHARLLAAGRKLVDRAQAAGAVPAETRVEDLLKLVNGISLASGDDPDQAARLLTLAIRGIAPARSE
ncbi:TetR/AcrR family transcriptional regulator [Kribbella sp. NPDC059898]|uniref:TetR/AcrR family transcriptional regulator n=1 Tax=Kribbella sp. NPDC059898 TaxID=3346995 RepID=UPI003651F341